MITDIPSPSEFQNYALDYMNLSWEQVVVLLRTLDEFKVEIDRDVPNAFWLAAQRPLATAVSLCHQGVEFLLKARISAVSPYLLIKGEPNKWPSKCEFENKQFSAFYTLDAEDLVRVCNTVADARLPEAFAGRFNEVRRLRNSIAHTVDSNLVLNASEILTHILFFSDVFFGPLSWLPHRKSYMERDTNAALYSTEHIGMYLAYEFSSVVEHLAPAPLREHFGFDKKRRRYICPVCSREDDSGVFEYRMAVLEPNTSASVTMYCFVCDSTSEIVRTSCKNAACKGTVIYDNYMCLTCGDRQD